MTLELNIASGALKDDAVARDLIVHLQEIEEKAGIKKGVIYYQFPLFRDADAVLYKSHVMLAARSHGLALFSASDLNQRNCTAHALSELDDRLTQLHSIIYGKLLKSRLLRESRQQLRFSPLAVLLLPHVNKLPR